MSAEPSLNRRSVLQRLVLGCAAALGTRFALATQMPVPDAVSRLALRVLIAAGAAHLPWQVVGSSLDASAPATIPELLNAIFADDIGIAAELETARLQQLLARRIEQDYQSGALVHIQGWWLARSEAAILQLGNRLAAHGVLL